VNKIFLQLESLTKRYPNVTAVSDLSLDIREGEIFGLLGPNGAGKTTTINMIAGFVIPDSGRILMNGREILPSDRAARGLIGLCPQENIHWRRLTVIEQLAFLGHMYGQTGPSLKSRCKMLLDSLDMVEVADQLAEKLSGGMKRRLNIALALINDPPLLILDEPEAGLDPQSRIMIRSYIKSLAREKTILLTTHNMDEADRLADRLAIMDRSKLLVLDTPEALKGSIGEGDVLEIQLLEDPNQFDLASIGLPTSIQISRIDDVLFFRALNLTNLLPQILSRISDQSIKTGELRLRKNSLEDIFIQLTGRRLQE
jgi:ABC-2 type transport system ATP-binding protein